ncbi:MAG: hypothetical protein V3V74_08165 [Nitrosomonadaceae bacterium]
MTAFLALAFCGGATVDFSLLSGSAGVVGFSSGEAPLGASSTGVAAPRLVAGAIAATWLA